MSVDTPGEKRDPTTHSVSTINVNFDTEKRAFALYFAYHGSKGRSGEKRLDISPEEAVTFTRLAATCGQVFFDTAKQELTFQVLPGKPDQSD
jgi:hypothetical protein